MEIVVRALPLEVGIYREQHHELVEALRAEGHSVSVEPLEEERSADGTIGGVLADLFDDAEIIFWLVAGRVGTKASDQELESAAEQVRRAVERFLTGAVASGDREGEARRVKILGLDGKVVRVVEVPKGDGG